MCIKISDEGGGIPRSGLKKIWTYLYSTADSPLRDMEFSEAGAGSEPVVLAVMARFATQSLVLSAFWR